MTSLFLHGCQRVKFQAHYTGSTDSVQICIMMHGREFELMLFGLPDEEIQKLYTAFGPPENITEQITAITDEAA
jgi:hypothetical protein